MGRGGVGVRGMSCGDEEVFFQDGGMSLCDSTARLELRMKGRAWGFFRMSWIDGRKQVSMNVHVMYCIMRARVLF
jgi:hypothetical protein